MNWLLGLPLLAKVEPPPAARPIKPHPQPTGGCNETPSQAVMVQYTFTQLTQALFKALPYGLEFQLRLLSDQISLLKIAKTHCEIADMLFLAVVGAQIKVNSEVLHLQI